LLQCHASVNTTMSLDRTPLLLACQKGHAEIVQLLVDHDRDAMNSHPDKHWPPLWVAVNRGFTSIVKILLEAGVDPNSRYIGRSVLHEAIRKEQVGIVKLLLNAGAVISKKDADNNTPLHSACRMGNKEIISMLLSAPLYVRNAQGATPLDLLPQDSTESDEIRRWSSTTPIFCAPKVFEKK